MYLDNNIKEIIKNRIYEKINPEKIILFGSYAYGTATDESDIDIMVVENKLLNSKVKEAINIKKILEEIKKSKDIIVLSKEEFEFYKTEAGSVVREAYERGEVL